MAPVPSPMVLPSLTYRSTASSAAALQNQQHTASPQFPVRIPEGQSMQSGNLCVMNVRAAMLNEGAPYREGSLAVGTLLSSAAARHWSTAW